MCEKKEKMESIEEKALKEPRESTEALIKTYQHDLNALSLFAYHGRIDALRKYNKEKVTIDDVENALKYAEKFKRPMCMGYLLSLHDTLSLGLPTLGVDFTDRAKLFNDDAFPENSEDYEDLKEGDLVKVKDDYFIYYENDFWPLDIDTTSYDEPVVFMPIDFDFFANPTRWNRFFPNHFIVFDLDTIDKKTIPKLPNLDFMRPLPSLLPVHVMHGDYQGWHLHIKSDADRTRHTHFNKYAVRALKGENIMNLWIL